MTLLSKKQLSTSFFYRWSLLNFTLAVLNLISLFFSISAIFSAVCHQLFFWSTFFQFLCYFQRGWSEIFQLGYLTYLEATRKKVFLILLLFALGTMGYSVFLSSVIPKDQLKVLERICFTTATLFGSVVAIFLSASIIPKDIKDKTIFSIIPKPVRRFEYVLGRLVGCWIILGIMVFSMMLMCLLLVEKTLSDLKVDNPYLSQELASSKRPYRPVKILDSQQKEFQVCKNCFSQILVASQHCKAHEGHEEGEDELLHEEKCLAVSFMKLQKERPSLKVPIYDEVTFVYQKLPLNQFKKKEGKDDGLESPLLIHFPVIKGLTRRIPFLFSFENPSTKKKYSERIYIPPTKEHWAYFPTNAIDKNGDLRIIVSRLHPDLNSTSVGGLLVFGSLGRIEVIFVKSFFLLYLSLILLSLLSLTCSTFLSTPVAVVFSAFLFLLGNMLDFLLEFVESLRKKGFSFMEVVASDHGHSHGAEEHGVEHAETLLSTVIDFIGDAIEFFCQYFIDFSYFNLNHLLQIGVDLPFHILGDRFQYFCLCCFPLFVISYLSFRYRELG